MYLGSELSSSKIFWRKRWRKSKCHQGIKWFEFLVCCMGGTNEGMRSLGESYTEIGADFPALQFCSQQLTHAGEEDPEYV
jgi:hypothetical protein